jgi:phosphoglycerate dehydrogenase-like enzyme
MMKKILLAGEFALSDEQKERLQKLAEIDIDTSISSQEELIEKAKTYDVLCNWGEYLPDSLGSLENMLVTYPYTEIGEFDSKKLAEKGVYVANSKGGNRKSIVEWTMFMIISLHRQFPKFLRTTTQYPFTSTDSLEGKKVVIVGHGTIGSEVGSRCEAFGMEVAYFERGENLAEKVAEADVVVNALNCNASSNNLLNAEFFTSMKKGSYYVTFARPFTYDIDGLIEAVNSGHLAGAAIDCDPQPLFDVSNDFYKKCLSSENVLVTPHVAGVTRQASANGLEIMVQNVEAYLNGEPINIVEK